MRRLVPFVLFFVLWVPGAYAWTWPVTGPVLQGFSFDPAHPYAGGQHRGIDIAASATGIPVLAPASGVVSYAGTVPTSGKSVTIETAGGLSVSLTHLGSYSVKKDDAVTEGDTLGTVGPSGTLDFDRPYLHLGVRTTAEAQGYLDPLGFLPSLAPPPTPPAPAPAPPPAPAVEAPPPVVAQPPAPVELAPPPAPAPVEQVPAPQPEAAPAPAPAPAPAAAPTPSPSPTPVVETPAPAATPVAPAEDPGPDLVLRPVAISIPVTTVLPLPRLEAGFNPVVDVRTSAAVAPRPHVHVPPLVRPRRPELPVAVANDARVAKHTQPHAPLLEFGLVAAAVALVGALMIVRWFEGAGSDELAAEDPRRGRVAVRERSEASGPRRRPGRSVRHLRPLPPLERQRRPEGERDGRARHAGDGVRRPGGRVAA